jgi:surfeit locus 1 family protein
MRVGHWIFTPTLGPTLATLLILPVLLALGFWQLDRARQKEALQRAFESHRHLPSVPLTSVNVSDPASRYRKVTVQGRYDRGHQILLDNQVVDGQPGYDVFTPLQVVGEDWAILVNRGWVPLGESRQKLPDIAIADTQVSIQGRIAQPANPALRLGDARSDVLAWPQVVQYLDYKQVAQALGYPLAPAVILLDPALKGGYRRQWHPQFAGFGPQRHQGYAVQWFALAVVLVIIYIAVNTRRCRPEEVTE